MTLKTIREKVASISNNTYVGKDITTNQTFEKEFEVKCSYNAVEAAKVKKAKVSDPVKEATKLFEKFDTGNIVINGKSVGNVSREYGLICLLNKQQARGIVKFPKIA